jgi:hypothetical protein
VAVNLHRASLQTSSAPVSNLLLVVVPSFGNGFRDHPTEQQITDDASIAIF